MSIYKICLPYLWKYSIRLFDSNTILIIFLYISCSPAFQAGNKTKLETWAIMHNYKIKLAIIIFSDVFISLNLYDPSSLWYRSNNALNEPRYIPYLFICQDRTFFDLQNTTLIFNRSSEDVILFFEK